MHGAVEAGLPSSSRRDFRQDLATRMKMAGSAWAFHLAFLVIYPTRLSAGRLDHGRVLSVLIYRATKLRADFRREESIGGKFVMRDYGMTKSMCDGHADRSLELFSQEIIMHFARFESHDEDEDPQVCSSYEPRCSPFRIRPSRVRSNIRPSAHYG
jgi:hypothetical protein